MVGAAVDTGSSPSLLKFKSRYHPFIHGIWFYPSSYQFREVDGHFGLGAVSLFKEDGQTVSRSH